MRSTMYDLDWSLLDAIIHFVGVSDLDFSRHPAARSLSALVLEASVDMDFFFLRRPASKRLLM